MKQIAAKLALTSVTLLAAASLGACSGSAASGGNKNTQSSTLVKVGVSVPLSGPTATAGTATACGADAYFNLINAKGGVNGYTFETNAQDNKYDAAQAAQIAQGFSADGSFAVIVQGTAMFTASTPVLQPKKLPVFGGPDGAIVTPGQDGIYGYNPIYADEGASAADFVTKTLKLNSAAVAYLAPPAAKGAKAFAEKFKESGGTVPLVEGVPTSVGDFAPLAQKLKDTGAEAVYTMLVDTQLSGLQKAAAAIGYKPAWVTWAIAYGPSYVQLAGALAEGTYTSRWGMPASETNDPAVKDYVDALTSMPKCAALVGDNAADTGYASAAAIVYGVKQATEGGAKLDVDKFNAALSNVRDMQLGITPGQSFDSASHASVRENSFWQVKDGQLVKVQDYQPLTHAAG
ncbi:ABC transporter substrate-binding protein [Arthrobacter sp. NPDC058097]|uniref:ABC transporter substrate-binding protein n=1 Tax=Arthrobacter sp. NPDC058097 TaxID=3346340 RepID=UPI0036DD7E0D